MTLPRDAVVLLASKYILRWKTSQSLHVDLDKGHLTAAKSAQQYNMTPRQI
jgi:hypothetical protein